MIKLFKKKQEVKTVEVVEISGHRFRVLDPVSMPNVRRIRFFTQDFKNDLLIGKDEIKTFLRKGIELTAIPEALNISQLNAELLERNKHIHTLLATLESVLSEDFNYTPTIRSASIIILLDGEDVNEIDEKIQAKKLELCRNNADIEAFFLTTILTFQTSLVNMVDISKPSDWLEKSPMSKKLEEKIYKIIHSKV